METCEKTCTRDSPPSAAVPWDHTEPRPSSSRLNRFLTQKLLRGSGEAVLHRCYMCMCVSEKGVGKSERLRVREGHGEGRWGPLLS